MIMRSDLLTLNFYKKSPFTGSHNGKCYRVEKISEGDAEKLQASIWPGPFCYNVTPDEQKQRHTEEFSEAGMEAIVAWLNEMSTDTSQ